MQALEARRSEDKRHSAFRRKPFPSNTTTDRRSTPPAHKQALAPVKMLPCSRIFLNTRTPHTTQHATSYTSKHQQPK